MSTLNAGETLQPFKPLRNNLIFDSSGNLVGIQNDRANGSDLRIGGGSGVDGTFATLIATTALKLNSGATFDLYNTADQTTNYERLRAYWTGNTATIQTQQGGTGTLRNMVIGSLNTAATTTIYGSFASISLEGSGSGGITFARDQSSANTNGARFVVGATPSSGTNVGVLIDGIISQSGTAGYTMLDINPTESSTGSGTKLLQRWAVGGTTRAGINNNGEAAVAAVYASGVALGASPTVFGGDVILSRDAANTLAQRNSTNAQTFRIYKTYTDASNYERLDLTWSGSQAFIGVTYAGTGAGRELQFVSYGSAAFTLTATAHMALAAGTTARSQINFASSTAPTSPADGDLWFDGTNLKLRVSGATYTLTKT